HQRHHRRQLRLAGVRPEPADHRADLRREHPLAGRQLRVRRNVEPRRRRRQPGAARGPRPHLRGEADRLRAEGQRRIRSHDRTVSQAGPLLTAPGALITVLCPSEDVMRAAWIEKRRGLSNVSQMHFARQGVVTEEMEHVARRERLPAELIRSEVARGRMIVPANVNHPELEPMAIGIAAKCKINANIGNSQVNGDVKTELTKLDLSLKHGADTVMDLSTGGDIPHIRGVLLRASSVPLGTVPIYEAVERVKRIESLTAQDLLDIVEEQAKQGVDYMTIHAGILRHF